MWNKDSYKFDRARFVQFVFEILILIFLLLPQQDPFRFTICDRFKKQLTDEENERLDACLMKFDKDQFLESMYEFIITYIQHHQESGDLHLQE